LRFGFSNRGVSKVVAAIVIIVILAVATGAIYFSTLSSTSKVPSATSSAVVQPPTTFTYEVAESPAFLDPSVAFSEYDLNILQNVYENLVWFKGGCGTCVIPWLAENYTVSSDLKEYNFTLRPGITFADGEPLNSMAVYFSFNRVLLEDGSTPVSHGTQASWLMQQLLNTSLSSVLCCAQTYDQNYVNNVLAQNFVQVTGPMTFTVHTINPSAAFGYIIAGVWGGIIAPQYTVNHDLALWNQTSTGYKLPYPSLSGVADEMTMFHDYFLDLVATCNSGVTPSGCGTTYLDGSYSGSLAGTGPYEIQSFSTSTNDVTLQANPSYWGGPAQFSGGQKVTPYFQTVKFHYVPDQATREIDLRSAARANEAMAIDVANTNLYDVANRNSWTTQNQLVSVIPGVSLYGVYTFYGTLFDPFDTNVTNALTGAFYSFQPFADQRMRLAFADSVNMTDVSGSVNNNLAPVALNVVPEGIPPENSFNASIKPIYSYNPDAVQNLLLDAMMHPLTSFTFTNGTAAPPGFFNNAFGCATLNSNSQCSKPVPQSMSLYYATGDVVDEYIMNQIAGVVNNVSLTYNMGLSVQVVPLPLGELTTEAFSPPSHFYMYSLGYEMDYPWVLDFLAPMYNPGGAYSGPDGWNVAQLANLYSQAVAANSRGDIPGLIGASNQMNTLANQAVMYLWTFDTTNFITMTSNVQGFYYNPSINPAGPGGVGPEYFATLY
jgi:ABC-type transport system substrate-binding protein